MAQWVELPPEKLDSIPGLDEIFPFFVSKIQFNGLIGSDFN